MDGLNVPPVSLVSLTGLTTRRHPLKTVALIGVDLNRRSIESVVQVRYGAMFGSTASSLRDWWAEVQPFVTRLSDCLLSYLRDINTPSRMILFLVATIFCYVVLGVRPKPAL